MDRRFATEELGVLRSCFFGVFLAVDQAKYLVGEIVLGYALGGILVVLGHHGLDISERDESEELQVSLYVCVGCSQEELAFLSVIGLAECEGLTWYRSKVLVSSLSSQMAFPALFPNFSPDAVVRRGVVKPMGLS